MIDWQLATNARFMIIDVMSHCTAAALAWAIQGCACGSEHTKSVLYRYMMLYINCMHACSARTMFLWSMCIIVMCSLVILWSLSCMVLTELKLQQWSKCMCFVENDWHNYVLYDYHTWSCDLVSSHAVLHGIVWSFTTTGLE